MQEVIHLVNEMSPYLLLGFLLAGLMHAFIPGTIYSRYLSGRNIRSVIYAALFGIPLPLCSCGVIPTAMSLRREGASKGATVSFLIATPETGVDSIIATFSLLGLPFAIIRPIAALCNALLAGSLVNCVEKAQGISNPNAQEVLEISRPDSHLSFWGKIKEAIRYGYGEMMEDIGKWLVIGLIVAGLITVFVPDTLFASFKDNSLMSMVLVLCIAIPMYICATGSIPIAVALMMKGLTPGAALVLLMAGPACNMASILVINKVLGRKTLATYLFSIFFCAIGWGLIVDHLLPTEWFTNAVMAKTCCGTEPESWFNIGCSIFLALLLLNALWNHYHHPQCHCHEDACHCHGEHHEDHCTCNHEEDHCTCSCEGHCSCNSEDHCKTEEEVKSTSITFKIKGLNCSHCCANAVKVMKTVPGVLDASVDLASGEATVWGEASPEELEKALGDIGFTAVF